MISRPFDFKNAAGQALSGRLDLPNGAPRAYALFAHCFTCSKSSLAATRVSRALAALGVGVLRFDFTGLGDSEGDFVGSGFSGEVADIAAAVAQMEAAGIGPSLLVGHSLGGAAVLAAAPDLPGVKAVATIGAPFDPANVERLFGDKLGELKANGQAEVELGGRPYLLRQSFVDDLRRQDQGAHIAALRKALLILHAPLDTVVSVDNASAIFLAARHPKSFISLDKADHLLTRQTDADYAAEVIAAWAEPYLPPRTPKAKAPDDKVIAELTGDGKFQVKVTAGDEVFYADEPPEVGGGGTGPSPYGLIAAGLGACTAMTLRLYADQKAWPLSKVSVAVSHAKVAGREPPDVFTREITVDGDLTEDQRARLLEIADRCPVHKTLERGIGVETMLTDHPKPMPAPEPPAQHCWDMEAACAEAD